MPVNSLQPQDFETKRPSWAQPSGSSQEVEKGQHGEWETLEERLSSEGSGDKDASEGRTNADECSDSMYSF